VKGQIALLSRQYNQFLEMTSKELALLGLTAQDVVMFEERTDSLANIATNLSTLSTASKNQREQVAKERVVLVGVQEETKKKLNEPQLRHQQSVRNYENWENKLKELMGSAGSPDSSEGLKARLTQFDALPADLTNKRAERERLTSEIFSTLDRQRSIRSDLFKPVQDLIEENALIKNDYKLQFRATLAMPVKVFADSLFTFIKQNAGDFRGEAESVNVVERLVEKTDFSSQLSTLDFVRSLSDAIFKSAKRVDKNARGIGPMLRVSKGAAEVYDFLFGLGFLEPRYTLLFQDTPIEFLSPGQRGALLLIFYLLVDKGHNPIILDQPEENLDNETVVSLLVPVLAEAKKRRQIIMVTHNPNLAVVCDAEQVIYSSFDRKAGCVIQYTAGSIENGIINGHVVNVLEGTKPAFNNRRIKYH
jgi:hypothetical protein